MRINKLDGLRGVFCLMLIFFHYDTRFLPNYLADFFVFRESYIFVDFFFVLSGFVISYNYSNLNSFSDFKGYIKKRFIRLFPLLFYSTTVFLFVDIAFNEFFPQYIDSKDSLSQLLLWYSDSVLFLNGIFINTSSNGLNGVSWSISAEMIAYIVFAVITLLFKNRIKNIAFLILLALCYFFLFNLQKFIVMGDYGFIRGVLSFILGYFVSVLFLRNYTWDRYWEYALFVGLLLELYVSHQLFGAQKEMFLLFAFPISFAFVILVLLNSDGVVSSFLNTKFIQYLGKLSYSIYLNHLIVLLLFPNFMFRFIFTSSSDVIKIVVFISTFFIVIFYSKLTNTYIENKGKILLNKLFSITTK